MRHGTSVDRVSGSRNTFRRRAFHTRPCHIRQSSFCMLCTELLWIRSFHRTYILSAPVLSGHSGNDACPRRGEPYPSSHFCCCRNAHRRNHLEEDRKVLLASCTCVVSGYTWIYTYRCGAFTPRRLFSKYLHWIHHHFRATRCSRDIISPCDQYVLTPTIIIALLMVAKYPMSQQQIKP